MNYLIKGASVVNEGEIYRADVLIADGWIKTIFRGGGLAAPGTVVINAAGKFLIPGIIDEHVHFREPGLTYKADIYTESRAAVAGGVTSFMDMPNTVPQTVTRRLLEEKFDIASQKSLANYSFYIGATNDNLDEVLSIDVHRVCGIKLFLGSSTGDMLVSDGKALEELFRQAPCLIAAHCEDEEVIRRNTGYWRELAASGKVTPDATIHPRIRTSQACFSSTKRAVELAVRTGARLHILHVSTEEELALLRSDIPLEDKKITAETCPHYLFFDERHYKSLGYAIKCNPAIKSPADRQALRKALKSGLIDTIGTDHAPHLRDEKFTGDCFAAKSGFSSIQHGFEIMNELQGEEGGLTLPETVRLMSHNPAILYGIDRRGFIREGYHADLAIVDPEDSHVISDAQELSKCGWSPYDGLKVRAGVTHTFVGGNLVYENGILHEESRGNRLEFNR